MGIDIWECLFLHLTPVELKRAAQIYNPGVPRVIPMQHSGIPKKKNIKFRIGFLGGKLNCHTTTYIIRGLIRCLDQGKFDVLTLVTLGRHDQDMCKEDLNNISQMHTLPDAVSN